MTKIRKIFYTDLNLISNLYAYNYMILRSTSIVKYYEKDIGFIDNSGLCYYSGNPKVIDAICPMLEI